MVEKYTFIAYLGFGSTWAPVGRPSVNLVEVYISLKTQKRKTLSHLSSSTRELV